MQSRLAVALTQYEWPGSMTELAIEQNQTNGFAAPSEKGEVQAGNPLPWGAHQRGDGVNFALFSRQATRVRLELYQNADDSTATRIIDLDPVRHRTGDVWHVWVRGVPGGQLYGYRIEGPYRPDDRLPPSPFCAKKRSFLHRRRHKMVRAKRRHSRLDGPAAEILCVSDSGTVRTRL